MGAQQLRAVKNNSYITNLTETELRPTLAKFAYCPPLLDDIDANTDGYGDRHADIRK